MGEGEVLRFRDRVFDGGMVAGDDGDPADRAQIERFSCMVGSFQCRGAHVPLKFSAFARGVRPFRDGGVDLNPPAGSLEN